MGVAGDDAETDSGASAERFRHLEYNPKRLEHRGRCLDFYIGRDRYRSRPVVAHHNDGVKHVAYIENYDSTGDYGAIHYASNNGSGWTDLRLTATYSHDPALAANAVGDVYLIG